MKIEIYGTSTCGVCKQVVSYLKNESIQHNYMTVGREITIDDLTTRIGRSPRTVPIIVVDNKETTFETLKDIIKTSKELSSFEL